MGGQGGGCGRRSEVIVKIQKKNRGGGRGGGWGREGPVGGQGGWERRSEVIVKIQKKIGVGVGVGDGVVRVRLGVRVDGNEELKLLWKCKKKVGGQVRDWGVEGWGLVEGRGLVGSNVGGRW